MPDDTGNVPEVCITGDMTRCEVAGPSGPLEIRRITDPEHRLSSEWSRTSRPAPPAVLQPLVPVSGVVPLGELELIEALQSDEIVVVDARKKEQFAKYTIPGAIALPFTEIDAALETLGCRREGETWNCSEARALATFCNGTWCGQSPTAIRKIAAAGFPLDCIQYYRDGLQGWLLQGLSVWTPGSDRTFHI